MWDTCVCEVQVVLNVCDVQNMGGFLRTHETPYYHWIGIRVRLD